MAWRDRFRRSAWDDERAREMEAHLQLQIDDLVAGGMPPDEARLTARRLFGNPRVIREEIHAMNSIAFVDAVIRDARYAVRGLRRAPAFSVTAITTLGLAIAVNTAVFSVVDAVLLKPLPYPDPERLGLVSSIVGGTGPERRDTSQTGRTWELVRDHATTVDRAVFSGWTTGANLVAAGRAAHVRQQRVSARFFEVLGVRPAIGRSFQEAEDRAGGPAAAILSHALWTSMFGSDPAVIGRMVSLRGEPATIVGVMPAGFNSGYQVDLWTPLRPSPRGEGEGENYSILVRLADGASWPQASAEIEAIGRPIVDAQRSREQRVLGFSTVPLQEAMTGDLRGPLLMLWAAVGVVLLVAAVNLAGLLLARTAARTREIATRVALGSGRATVVRQLFVESAVIAAFGTVSGIALGFVALDLLVALSRGAIEIWQPAVLDWRAVAAATLLATASTAGFGLAPALQAGRMDVQSGLLASGARTVAGGASRWPRRLIVVAQVALGVVLLAGAGLLLRTFAHARGLDPGFDPQGLTAGRVSLEDARYRSGVRVRQLFDETLARLDSEPGIEAASVSLGLPYERLLNLGFRRLDGARGAGMTSGAYVTANYFSTMRIPIRRGRPFDHRDTTESSGVVVVSETFARTYFRDEDALGRRIRFAGVDREIVGIAGDVQVRPGWGSHGPLATMPLAYIPVSQASDDLLRLVHGWFTPVVIVRSAAPDVRSAMWRALETADPQLPFAAIRSLSEVQADAIARQRFLMSILVALAVAAVLLSALGIHGLIATAVTERTREMGIRMALGATSATALRALALPGIALAATGAALGTALALSLSSVLRRFVWGVSPTDPLTFASVVALLLGVAVVASTLPALRILKLDPASTLRAD